MPLDLNNTTIKLGRDAMEGLIIALTEALDALEDHDLFGVIHEDAQMAIREAREWMGEDPECEGGMCHR
jgi:hypothetical protein